jgi:hypothetical protein
MELKLEVNTSAECCVVALRRADRVFAGTFKDGKLIQSDILLLVPGKYTKSVFLSLGFFTCVNFLGFNGSSMGNFSKTATIFLSDNLVKTVSFSGVGVQ